MRLHIHLVALACSLVFSSALADPDGGAGAGADEPAAAVPGASKPSNPPGAGSGVGAGAGTLADIFAQIQDQPAIRRAGLRAGVLERVQIVVPTVVIVKDAKSYLLAISGWEKTVRFPVLWDDGTVQSHEDIARFVRAFKPERVIELVGSSATEWVGDRGKKQDIFEQVLSKALDEQKPDWQAALDALGEEGIISPGMVVTDVNDSAWPAALALAAGRFQPISFVQKPSSVYQPMSIADADALERAIERAARATGRSWEGIGDDIDAITLAVNTGTMIKSGSGARDRFATTDRIGRMGSNGTGKRWAWCGQIIGNESRSVYQAMCSLFLSIDNGFVWDGYAGGQPWDQYDGTEAGKALESAGLVVELNDRPRNTLKDWKFRMVRPVGESLGDEGSAGLFLMNSKGASNVFDLPGAVDGSGKPGHMPILEVPMALHLVHSFSLQSPMNRNTVGGRLLERGVFVYAGSVDEPFLQGFVPTPAVAHRLAGSVAFAAAVHFDKSQVWKITVLGDPLVTIGPGGRRASGEVKLPGAVDLELRYKERLKEEDFEGAIVDLSLLGRDEAVARIAIALMKDRPEAFEAGIAQASIPALFRVGEYIHLIDAYERLSAMGQIEPLMQDLLWLASPYVLSRTSSDPAEQSRIEALLRANLRSHQKIQDAEDLAMHLRKRSLGGAVGVLEALRPTLRENQVKMLDRAIARVRK